MGRKAAALVAGLAAAIFAVAVAGGGCAAPAGVSAQSTSGMPAAAAIPLPPIADPQELVAAYYQAFAAGVNSGDFGAVAAFFTSDGVIDSPLVAGGAAGTAQIVTFFQKLPAMTGFTVETSNITIADPYVDIDWRFRAARGSLRGYLDGHDSFTIVGGLISVLEQQVDPDAAAQAFMPPPNGPMPTQAAVATARVRIKNFSYAPAVIRVPVGATVTWTNLDADVHAVTTDDKTIDSGVIEEGISAGLTFPAAGDYPYYCTVHPGMRGRILVGSP